MFHSSTSGTSKYVHLLALNVDNVHTPVQRVEICRSQVDHFIHFFLSCMSQRIQDMLGYIRPEWHLPSTLILKTLNTDWYDDEYHSEEIERERKLELQREINAYKLIKLFQGEDYPVFLGEVEVNGTPGIALSDIGGSPLCDISPDKLSAKLLRKLVERPIRQLVAKGIEPTDFKLDNFHFIEGPPGRIMMLDFGDVDDRRSDNEDEICKEFVGEVMRRYKRTLQSKKGLAAHGMKYNNTSQRHL